MWQNIAGLGIVLTLISIIFGYFMVRLGRYELILDKKVNDVMCIQKNEELKRELDRGEKAFVAINEQLIEQGKLLTRIDTTVKMILEREKNN